jgi:hypothetical protein
MAGRGVIGDNGSESFHFVNLFYDTLSTALVIYCHVLATRYGLWIANWTYYS